MEFSTTWEFLQAVFAPFYKGVWSSVFPSFYTWEFCTFLKGSSFVTLYKGVLQLSIREFFATFYLLKGRQFCNLGVWQRFSTACNSFFNCLTREFCRQFSTCYQGILQAVYGVKNLCLLQFLQKPTFHSHWACFLTHETSINVQI